MIKPRQLRDDIVIPVLQLLVPLQHDQSGNDITAAVELLMGTAMQESRCGEYIHQLGNGPALGVFQMEPATEHDLWTNYLEFHPEYRVPIGKLICGGIDRTKQLEGNLYYAVAMARMLYMRVPAALPAKGDLGNQAAYYKKWYNTPLGAATVDEYINNWHELQRVM